MKKIFALILALMLVCAAPLVAFAEGEDAGDVATGEFPEDISTPEEEMPVEGEILPPESVPEETPGDETEGDLTPADPEDEIAADVFTRIWEFVNKYSVQISSYLTMIVISIFAFYQKNKNGVFFTGFKKVLQHLVDTKSTAGEMSETQKGMCHEIETLAGKVDSLTEAVRGEQEKRAESEKTLAEYKTTLAANCVSVMSVLRVLHIAYISSPNVPDAMKNLITTEYSSCLSRINSDEELKRVYSEMRETLGIDGKGGDNEEHTV